MYMKNNKKSANRTKKWLLSSAIIASLIMATGCTTIQSSIYNDANFDPIKTAGLTYFLPLQKMKLKITPSKMSLAEAKTRLAKVKKSLADSKTSIDSLTVQLLKSQIASRNLTGALKKYEEEKQAKLQKKIGKALKADKKLKAEKVAATNYLASATAAQPGACTYAVSLGLTKHMPDSNHRFVANLNHNIFRDDTVKLKVTDTGLLSSANVIADDKTGDILVEIAGLIGAFVQPVSATIKNRNFNRNSVAEEPTCTDLRPLELIFDPMQKQDLKDIENERARAKLPIKISVREHSEPGNNYQIDKKGYDKNSKKMIHHTGRLATANGLYYRTPAPLTLEIKQCKTKARLDCRTVSSQIAMLPQAGPVSYVSMKSSAFVKTVNDVGFKNGVLVSSDITRPGEALVVAGLPLAIVRSFFGAAGEIFSLKVDYSSEAEARAAQTVSYSQQLAKNAAINACVELATNSAGALACYSD